MKFVADNDNILVCETIDTEPEVTTASGIILTGSAAKKIKQPVGNGNWYIAEVVSVGPGYYAGEIFVKIKKEPGDKVVLTKLSQMFMVDEEIVSETVTKKYWLVKHHEVLGYAYEEEV